MEWVVTARRGEKWVRVFSGESVFVGDGDIAGEGAIGAPCFFLTRVSWWCLLGEWRRRWG